MDMLMTGFTKQEEGKKAEAKSKEGHFFPVCCFVSLCGRNFLILFPESLIIYLIITIFFNPNESIN